MLTYDANGGSHHREVAEQLDAIASELGDGTIRLTDHDANHSI